MQTEPATRTRPKRRAGNGSLRGVGSRKKRPAVHTDERLYVGGGLGKLSLDEVGPGTQLAAPLSYRARLADAESDAAEMELQGVDAAHAECLALIDQINAQRKGATVRIAPVSLQDAIDSRAVAHVRNGIYERALATSEARRKQADVMAWASYCFAKKAKITLQEWRAMQ